MQDQYDNAISTSSDAARDHYVKGVDLLLSAQIGISQAFQRAIDVDPGFALAYAGLARAFQFEGDVAAAKAAINQASDLAASSGSTLTGREKSHVNALALMINGQGAQAYKAIREHVDEHPRDAVVAQTCSSVFGLIGFSGQPGREAEILAYTSKLLPHYGEDWWCLSQHAFALCENGNQDLASSFIDRSLALRADNAHGAHVRSHIYYECGDTQLGIDYLEEWLKPYDRSGYMHGHLSWHAALWSLEMGDVETMWRRIDADVAPGASDGLPINILTDTASILYRAELAGVEVDKQRWVAVSEYAKQYFPTATLGFCDIHAALAHAMAGDGEELTKLIENPNPITGDLVTPIAQAYRAIADNDWAGGVRLLSTAMADHARLGGSRAQRDLLEFSLLGGLLKLGKDEEASRMLMMRRPALTDTHSVHGLSVH